MFASFCSLWGLSARCGEECYIRQLLLFSSASSVFVSFFCFRQLNGNALGLRPRPGGSRRPGAPGKLPRSSRKCWKTGFRAVSGALAKTDLHSMVDF